ncbi:MAG: hypothetical protein WCR33_04090 [Bacilli bacterium]
MNTDILSKFDDIEVNNNTRISADDQIYCEDQERQYKEFLSFADEYILYLNYNPIANKYYKSENLITNMETTKNNLKDQFISNIISHFRDEYRVTLKDEPIQKKYGIEITYNIIVDEIIEQLEGYNFTDKASKEIKEAMKDEVRGYNGNVKAEIKKKKVVFDSFFYVDCWDKKYGGEPSIGYSSRGGFYKLLKAISHFEQGVTESVYNNIDHAISYEKGDKVFKEHSLMCIKAEYMKLFKNGKVEITFLAPEYAQQFAKEYCGYIGGVN